MNVDTIILKWNELYLLNESQRNETKRNKVLWTDNLLEIKLESDFLIISQSLSHCRSVTMANFNMQEFNEILEKCKDQSQQQKQDQVRF